MDACVVIRINPYAMLEKDNAFALSMRAASRAAWLSRPMHWLPGYELFIIQSHYKIPPRPSCCPSASSKLPSICQAQAPKYFENMYIFCSFVSSEK